MKYVIKPHARGRMIERSISERLVDDTIANPIKVLYDDSGRILFKKLYRNKGIDRLLIVVGEPKKDMIEIITVIETSKIKKYL